MYYTLILISVLFTLIPRKIALSIGRGLGFLIYTIKPIRKQIAQKNLTLCFPHLNNDQREKIIKNCYKHFGMVLVDFFRLRSLNKKNIDKILTIDKDTRKLLESQNGAIIMSGHIGNWEMCTPGFGFNDFPLGIVTQTQKNKSGDRFFNWIRYNKEVSLIPKKESKDVMKKILEDNKFLGLAIDQNAGDRGVKVPFFNSTTSMPVGAGYFHIKTKKPILIGFSILDDKLKYKLTIIEIDKNIINNKDNDLIYNVNQYFSKVLEEEIKKNPEQYFWFHRKLDKKNY